MYRLQSKRCDHFLCSYFLCRIQQITGLESLVKLDVLDLHGNQITTVQNLNHLTELRVLNLAGNQIEVSQAEMFSCEMVG